jgi:putative transposase
MKQNYWQTFYVNSYYHVYNRVTSGALLFVDYAERQFFMKQWQRLLGPYVDTYAYCLMSNHFHFIIKVKEADALYWEHLKKEKTVAARAFLEGKIDLNAFLEDQFKRFFSSYANKYNYKYKRHGSLFQKRFKRVELTTLAQILNKICYVHHNPIHHNAAAFYDAWEYSSYKAYLSNKPTNIVRTKGLGLFDDNLSIPFFVTFHQSYHENWVHEQRGYDYDFEGLGDN